MKADNKNGLFGWKATGSPNFSLIDFSIAELFKSKFGKILFVADRK